MKTNLWAFVNYFFSVLSFAVWQIRPQTGQSIHQTLKRKFLYCRYNFNLLFWFGRSNIWHIWMLPGQHLLWMWICVWVLYVSLVDFFFFCASHLPLHSSSPPIPPPCQACPHCSHTRDPSAHCKEPSSPRLALHSHPQLQLNHMKENFYVIDLLVGLFMPWLSLKVNSAFFSLKRWRSFIIYTPYTVTWMHLLVIGALKMSKHPIYIHKSISNTSDLAWTRVIIAIWQIVKA